MEKAGKHPRDLVCPARTSKKGTDMSRISPDGKVTRKPLRPPTSYLTIGDRRLPQHACDACGNEVVEPYNLCGAVQLCDDCCGEIAELWNHEHSGEWIIHREEPVKDQSDRKEYVYLASASTGEWKIGWSTDPERRVGSFDAKMPVEIEVVHFFEADEPMEAEKILHQWADSHNVKGEWFNFGREQIDAIKRITGFDRGEFYRGGDLFTEELKRILQ